MRLPPRESDKGVGKGNTGGMRGAKRKQIYSSPFEVEWTGLNQPTQQRSFYATAKLYRSQIIGTTNAFGNPGVVGVFGECFGLADGYQLVGEVMAHQGDDGLPCFIVGSQRQSISTASAGNYRG